MSSSHVPDSQGMAVPWAKTFSMTILLDMMRIRRMEEKAAELYGEQKIRGFLHLYIGEEAVAVGALRALDATDHVVATYREHGHALIHGIGMKAIMAEMYGKQEGCSGGRGGSMHLFGRSKNFYGGQAIVAGGLALSAGLALAVKLQNNDRVTACFFGEGAIAEGAFHETMNLATLWQLPLILFCENNLYAMGTALARSESQTDLCVKAASYGMATKQVDGMDVVAVYEASKLAVQQIRGGSGPVFMELKTYRYRAHSMFDPDLYRDKKEIESWKKRGPIHTFTERLKAQGSLTEEGYLELEKRAQNEVDAAVAFAEAGTWEPVAELLRDVYTRQGTM